VRILGGVALIGWCASVLCAAGAVVNKDKAESPPAPFQGVLLSPAQATEAELNQAKQEGWNAVALLLDEDTAPATPEAAKRVLRAGLALHYWLEIGRSKALADAHPEWMASLQGHPEWKRFFPEFKLPNEQCVAKTYPWVPILYRESFDAQRERVRRLLSEQPVARGVFLNDLQGAPSACGCGHPLCRWTSDYGPILTATRLGDDAAGKFVAAVKNLVPNGVVYPVWATECEQGDQAELCGGVGCFAGTCWKAWSRQLAPLAKEADTIAVLALAGTFQRRTAPADSEQAWPTKPLRAFEQMPPQRAGKSISTKRLLAVLEAWDAPPASVRAQAQQALKTGAAGFLIAKTRLDQSWEPKAFQPPRPAKDALP
jgi:hypothetical protein